jgi:hypothetical protein
MFNTKKHRSFNRDMKCRGIIGIANVSKSCLLPSINKENFENKQIEVKSLLKFLDKYANEYRQILNSDSNFWKEYGYYDETNPKKKKNQPSDEESYKKKREEKQFACS